MDSARDVANQAKSAARDYVNQARDAARDYANQAKDKAQDYADIAKNSTRGYAEEAKQDFIDYAKTDRDSLGAAKVTEGTQQDNAIDQIKHFVEAAAEKVDDAYIPPEAAQDFTH
uniref:Late embryogenesis abundant protein n=1 Tax=Acrobeloides nanus TaxID=290746 RepID=A0A914EH54_9BILA